MEQWLNILKSLQRFNHKIIKIRILDTVFFNLNEPCIQVYSNLKGEMIISDVLNISFSETIKAVMDRMKRHRGVIKDVRSPDSVSLSKAIISLPSSKRIISDPYKLWEYSKAHRSQLQTIELLQTTGTQFEKFYYYFRFSRNSKKQKFFKRTLEGMETSDNFIEEIVKLKMRSSSEIISNKLIVACRIYIHEATFYFALETFSREPWLAGIENCHLVKLPSIKPGISTLIKRKPRIEENPVLIKNRIRFTKKKSTSKSPNPLNSSEPVLPQIEHKVSFKQFPNRYMNTPSPLQTKFETPPILNWPNELMLRRLSSKPSSPILNDY